MLHSRISYCPEDTCPICRSPASGNNSRWGSSSPPASCGESHSPLDHIAGADAHPILAGKVAVDHCLFNASFNPLRRFLQLHLPQLIDNNFHLLAEGFIALLYMNRLKCMYCNVIQRSLTIFYILLASLYGIFESFEPKHIVTVSICE